MPYGASITTGEAKGKTSEWTRERERHEKRTSTVTTSPSTSRESLTSRPFSSTREPSSSRHTIGLGESDEDRRWRATNKRLATIFEEHGKSFTEPRSEFELAERVEEAKLMRKEDIHKVMQQLSAARHADLCFVVDATGSMQPHITGVKDMITKLVNELTRPMLPGKPRSSVLSELRLAIVAYRDHCDIKRFETLDFTRNVDQFRTFVGSISAIGGGDEPEDVLGGLDCTRKLSWSSESGTKVIFHIGDAPPHGSTFNSCLIDSYPKGHLGDPPLADLFGWMQDEKEIFYFFGKINASTDMMIHRFEEALHTKVACFDVKIPINIFDAVLKSVSSSVYTVVESSKLTRASVPERKYLLDKTVPNWNAVKQIEGRFQSYLMPASIEDILSDNPLVKCDPEIALVKIAQRPFAEGAERAAFYGLDETGHGPTPSAPVKVVFKEFKRVVLSAPSSKYESINQLQTIASYLAFLFTEELKKSNYNYLSEMKFLKLKTFAHQAIDGSWRYLTCERMFSDGDKFVRFSNNAGYTMLEKRALECEFKPEYVEMVMAFSHWTYHVTGGQLMVVDLEGIVTQEERGDFQVVLTDPAIHSVHTDRYGNLNHGKKGMDSFFETHQCGRCCSALKLPSLATPDAALGFGSLSLK